MHFEALVFKPTDHFGHLRVPFVLRVCGLAPHSWVCGGGAKFRTMPMPTTTRKTNVAVVLLALVMNLFAGGVVFGWGALVVVLQRHGVYHSLCDAKSSSLMANATAVVATHGTCAEQTQILQTIFLAGTFGSMSWSFPAGLFMDATTPKLTILCGCCMHVIGAALFSVSSDLLDLYATGYFLMGAAAPCILLGGVTLVSMYVEESRKGFVISILNGCYDASAIVWQLYAWIDSAFAKGVSISVFFFSYVGFVAILFLLVCAVVPGPLLKNSDDQGKQKPVELELESISRSPAPENRSTHTNNANLGTVKIPLNEQSLTKQLQSSEFLSFTAFFCAGLLRFSYYLGSIDSQLTHLGQENGSYSMIFGTILPLGVFSTPFIGKLIDARGLKIGFVVIYCFKFLHSLLTLIPNIDVQIAGFISFAIFRGCFFAVASAFLVQTFGRNTFGRIFGLSATIGAIFSLLQSPLLSLSLSTDNYSYSNFIVLGMTLCVLVMHVIYFSRRSSAQTKEPSPTPENGESPTTSSSSSKAVI